MSGSAAADSTIEYSVTFTGSTPVMIDEHAEQHRDQHDEVEARRLARPHVLAPLPPEVLRDAVAGRQRRLERGAERRGEDPEDHAGQAELARASAPTGSATCGSVSTPMCSGASTSAASAMIDSDSTPPSGKPM